MQVGETVQHFLIITIYHVVCSHMVTPLEQGDETTFSNDFNEEQICNGLVLSLLRLHVLAGCQKSSKSQKSSDVKSHPVHNPARL